MFGRTLRWSSHSVAHCEKGDVRSVGSIQSPRDMSVRWVAIQASASAFVAKVRVWRWASGPMTRAR
ncbi:MAG: hypothetical protein M0Z30_21855 [Actinomycetota bacterium]|nr:hypothetical protein [Actinomycetota bacterium]